MVAVYVVGTVGLPPQYGGWETLADNLTMRAPETVRFTVYCSSRRYRKRIPSYNNAELVYLPLNANGIQSVIYDGLSLFHAAFKAEKILILGVSGCIFLPIIRLLSGAKLIVNIDGIEWKRQKWGRYSSWFLKLSEGIAIKFSDVVITDNPVIRDYVKQSYGVDSETIPYGGDHVDIQSDGSPEFFDQSGKWKFLSMPYAFSVCRIEPENNIHVILEAFESIENLSLVIVGNWDNNTYGRQLRAKYGGRSKFHLLDPIYELNALFVLRSNCRIYIHGHSVGGTNPSLVEAMYLGLPVVCFDVSYNRATTHSRASYFSTDEELVDRVSEMMRDENYRAKVSKEMRSLALRHYTWEKVCAAYYDLFVQD